MKSGHPARGLERLDSRTTARLKICLLLSVVMIAMLVAFTPGRSVAAVATEYSSTPSTANASTTSTTPYPATGNFSVAQKPNGGWTLVTPQGEPFYASGIDTVAPDGSGTDQVTGVCPYCVTVAN